MDVKPTTENPHSDFVSADPFYRQVVEHMSNCVLCGNELELTHRTDYMYNTVQEEAHCHQCNIRNRSESFPLQ